MKIAFLDTETTSLRHDRRAWEVALILRDAKGFDHEYHWFIDDCDLELGNADVKSLSIGKFYDRHPQYRAAGGSVHFEADVLQQAERLTRDATVVGGVPSFDSEVLANRMRANNICPSWHYRTQDFQTLILGYLRGQGKAAPALPWKSDDLSRLIGVEPPADDERHTALGDARWALRVWDTIIGNISPEATA